MSLSVMMGVTVSGTDGPGVIWVLLGRRGHDPVAHDTFGIAWIIGA